MNTRQLYVSARTADLDGVRVSRAAHRALALLLALGPLTAADAAQLTLRWDIAADARIAHHQVRWRTATGDAQWTRAYDSNSITLNDLRPSTTYRIAVRACASAAAHCGPLSAEITATTAADGADGQGLDGATTADLDAATGATSGSARPTAATSDMIDDARGGPRIDSGEVILDAGWRRVRFDLPFADPIVILTPIGSDAGARAIVIDDIDPAGFSARLRHRDHRGRPAAVQRVSFLALERGRHRLPDGALVEAGERRLPLCDGAVAVPFDAAFDLPPVVIGNLGMDEGDSLTPARPEAIDRFGFAVAPCGPTAAPAGGDAVLRFIAWEPSIGALDGRPFEVGVTGEVVTGRRHQIDFAGPYRTPPVVLAGVQTANLPDSAHLRSGLSDAAGIEVRIAHRRLRSAAYRTVAEAVGYIAVASDADAELASPQPW